MSTIKIKTLSLGAAGNISHPNLKRNKLLDFSQLKSHVGVEVELGEVKSEKKAQEALQKAFSFLQPQVDEMVKQHLRAQYAAAVAKDEEKTDG